RRRCPPCLIKADPSLTRGTDRDGMRRALAGALIAFGRQTNCNIVAEGVESIAELDVLRALGVHAAQGYHLGRPTSFDRFRRLLRDDLMSRRLATHRNPWRLAAGLPG